MTDNTYNGWTNYATWRVNLEFFYGDADMYDRNHSGESAKEYVLDVVDSEFRLILSGDWDWSDYNRTALVQYACVEGWEYSEDVVALAEALALAKQFLDDVNWDEIADAYADDESEDDY